jgi:hypothetical protein
LDIPVDVDRFCNEVIEEGIAAQNVGHGRGQTAEIVPMSAATIGGTFDGHKSEGPRKAETTDNTTIMSGTNAFGGGTEVRKHVNLGSILWDKHFYELQGGGKYYFLILTHRLMKQKLFLLKT